jgi:WD40 repeat protein
MIKKLLSIFMYSVFIFKSAVSSQDQYQNRFLGDNLTFSAHGKWAATSNIDKYSLTEKKKEEQKITLNVYPINITERYIHDKPKIIEILTKKTNYQERSEFFRFVKSLLFSADDRYLAAHCGHVLEILEFNDKNGSIGRKFSVTPFEGHDFDAFAFFTDGRLLAVRKNDLIKIFEIVDAKNIVLKQSIKTLNNVQKANAFVTIKQSNNTLAFSKDGSFLCTAYMYDAGQSRMGIIAAYPFDKQARKLKDGRVKLFEFKKNAAEMEEESVFMWHRPISGYYYSGVRRLGESNFLIALGNFLQIIQYDFQSNDLISMGQKTLDNSDRLESFDVSPDGTWVVASLRNVESQSATLKTFKVASSNLDSSFNLLTVFSRKIDTPFSVFFILDGSFICLDNQVLHFDKQTGVIHELTAQYMDTLMLKEKLEEADKILKYRNIFLPPEIIGLVGSYVGTYSQNKPIEEQQEKKAILEKKLLEEENLKLLFEAIRKGDLKKVKAKLTIFTINSRADDQEKRRTPLMQAIWYKKENIANYILDRAFERQDAHGHHLPSVKANLQLTDSDGNTALSLAWKKSSWMFYGKMLLKTNL